MKAMFFISLKNLETSFLLYILYIRVSGIFTLNGDGIYKSMMKA